jgi:hypothetical protein
MVIEEGSLSKAILACVLENLQKNNWTFSFINIQALTKTVPRCEEKRGASCDLHMEVPTN